MTSQLLRKVLQFEPQLHCVANYFAVTLLPLCPNLNYPTLNNLYYPPRNATSFFWLF